MYTYVILITLQSWNDVDNSQFIPLRECTFICKQSLFCQECDVTTKWDCPSQVGEKGKTI